MISLIVMSVVSCKKKAANEPDDPSNPSEQTDPNGQTDPSTPSQGQAAFTITMSNITGSSAAMSVVPTKAQAVMFTLTGSSSGGSYGYGDDYSDYWGGSYYAPARRRMPTRKIIFNNRFINKIK